MWQAQTTVHHPASSQNILRTKGQLGSQPELFTQNICTKSSSDHVAISAFTSVLWHRSLTPSVILFIPRTENKSHGHSSLITSRCLRALHNTFWQYFSVKSVELKWSRVQSVSWGGKKSSSWDAAARSRRRDNEAGCLWRVRAWSSSLFAQPKRWR